MPRGARTSAARGGGRRPGHRTLYYLGILFCFICLWGQRTLQGTERGIPHSNWGQMVSATWVWRGEHVGCLASQELDPLDEAEAAGAPGCLTQGRETLCPSMPAAG